MADTVTLSIIPSNAPAGVQEVTTAAQASKEKLSTLALETFTDRFEASDTHPVRLYYENGSEVKDGDELTNSMTLFAAQSHPEQEESPVIRLCILGPGAVGKSALTLRYTAQHFTEDYDPTIEDAYRKTVEVDGRTATLDILDTAGQEDFTALRGAWYRKKDGFLLVFSLISDQSVTDLENFYEQLEEFYDNESPVPPFILVGNKCDLPHDKFQAWANAEAKCKEWNAQQVIKTSAKTSKNVDEAFAYLVRCVRRAQGAKVQKKKKSRCTIL